MAVSNGIAVQAAGGTGREELHRVADAALLNWPPT
jgi:UTP:GlnB (protein PII) uridylyltransferase